MIDVEKKELACAELFVKKAIVLCAYDLAGAVVKPNVKIPQMKRIDYLNKNIGLVDNYEGVLRC